MLIIKAQAFWIPAQLIIAGLFLALKEASAGQVRLTLYIYVIKFRQLKSVFQKLRLHNGFVERRPNRREKKLRFPISPA